MRETSRTASTDSSDVVGAVAAWLAANPDRRTISTFAPLPGEVDLLGLIERETGRRWVFPKVEGDGLRFHEIREPDEQLVAGAFGIREPRDGTALVPSLAIDLFLCPGLAFDPRGGRLGRGRGYYDRELAKASPGALRIGVCFPWQIVADTHAEPHDIHMDHVISG